jgi:hypothetical protein
MFWKEWDLGSETQVEVICYFYRCRLVVEYPDVELVVPLSHNHPHALTLDHDIAVLVLSLDVKDELRGLASLEVLACFEQRDPEGIRMCVVSCFAGAELPRVAFDIW